MFCGREFTRGGLSRHLPACHERQAEIEKADSGPGRTETLVHLMVQDAYGGDYWLHLEMRGSATLKALDNYLRSIWLECCGHLSRFSVGGWGSKEISMGKKVENVLASGVELTHIYDFGTSSNTLIKGIRARKGKPLTENPIVLMARNNAPEFTCSECGEPAAWVCMECSEWEDVLLCQAHADEHEHDDYLMPLVNSPRTGMCGYWGPAEPPY